MKKGIAALLIAALCMVSFTACKGKNNTSEDTGTSVSASTDAVGIITLGNYKGLTVEAEKTVPSDEEVTSYRDYYYQTKASEMNWNRTAEMGDTLVIDFSGKVDGVAFEGGTSEDYSIVLGSHTFIDGFEDAMVGMAVGETKDLDLQFPEDYWSTDLAGKPVVFTVTCKSIVPAMSDETVAAIQDENYSNISELETYVRGLVESYYEEDYNSGIIASALEQILAETTFGTLPEDRMAEMVDYVKENYGAAAESYGVDVDTYLTYYNTTAEELASVFVKRDLVFEAIGVAEGFEYTDEEVDAYVQQNIDEMGGGSTYEDAYAIEPREQYRKYMILDAVYKYLLDNTTVVETGAGTETTQE